MSFFEGFLSENTDFARRLQDAGILFIGPSPESLEEFGLKHRARELAIQAQVPVVPGTPIITTFEEAQEAVRSLGFPVMVKATAGGGGMGLQACFNLEELEAAVETVRSRGTALFNNAAMFIEKYVQYGRHIEAQIFGNGQGDVVFLGERECSIQRRHQKVIEEAPSPFVMKNPEIREKMKRASVLLAKSVKYKSAGTVEFLVDDETGQFYFLEMNTRLQVEHGVTELCYNVDIVEMMLLQARAELLSDDRNGGMSLDAFQRDGPVGHAIEVRVYAENPAKDFMPSPGLLQNVSFPTGSHLRVDTWIETGTNISPSFDPLLAKIMVHSTTRHGAIDGMQQALRDSLIQGPPTNMEFLVQILQTADFQSGYTLTNTLSKRFNYLPNAVEFLSPGAFTSIQDYPGRIGIPHGVPPSGPMDSLSFRAANILVGNPEGTEAFEITMTGPILKFYGDAIIAVCGAQFKILLNDEPIATWTRHYIKSGSRLEVLGTQVGARAYLAILGGLPSIATYLGSKSTAPTLNWGGFQGRCLRAGDFLSLKPLCPQTGFQPYQVPEVCVPLPERSPELYALPGVRMQGPPPKWGRDNGGEGGSHPSNMVGFGAPNGSVAFTGDSGIVYAVDGPDLTGYVVTQVVAQHDLWRLSQLRPGEKFKFTPITWAQALELEGRVDKFLAAIKDGSPVPLDWSLPSEEAGDGILHRSSTFTIRQAGERAILCVFDGDFSVRTRARVEQLARAFSSAGALRNLVAGNCSVYVPFDPRAKSQADMVTSCIELEKALPSVDEVVLPSRLIHLPALFDPRECHEAIERYMALQRPSAPFLPDNIEFIRRSNGLKTREDVKEVYFGKPMLVNVVGWLMGLPIYNPLDPRDHLVVPKFNPSRNWTKAGSLGTGGMSSSIYPNDGPGGHMLWGATIPGLCWDTYGRKPGFSRDQPWLFRAFDQIIFHEVSREEFDDIVQHFRREQYEIKIEPAHFDMTAYSRLMKEVGSELESLRALRQKCTQIELEAEAKLYEEWEVSRQKASEVTIGEDENLIKVSIGTTRRRCGGS
ncbi:unnamed protein product, partial [Clonostachys chloroleuca]